VWKAWLNTGGGGLTGYILQSTVREWLQKGQSNCVGTVLLTFFVTRAYIHHTETLSARESWRIRRCELVEADELVPLIFVDHRHQQVVVLVGQ
jgi:hypothetical protein